MRNRIVYHRVELEDGTFFEITELPHLAKCQECGYTKLFQTVKLYMYRPEIQNRLDAEEIYVCKSCYIHKIEPAFKLGMNPFPEPKDV